MSAPAEGGWDLIVVGAGSAGSVVAARCAARGGRVLLLEAGPDYRSVELCEAWRSPNPSRAIFDPAATRAVIWRDLLASRTDAQMPSLYWRGRGVGGSSSINGQIAIRPPREDFDAWAAAGCAGWAWDDVLPFFNRLEADHDYPDAPYHGDRGPIPVYRAPRETWGAVDEGLARAATVHGFPWAGDVNAPGALGVSPYPINSRAGRRVSTNDGYLEPVRDLPNLTIAGGALVDVVCFDGRRAVGVEYLDHGVRRRVLGGEVVLSAGVVHSAAILLRSGVGPPDALTRLGIPVVADLPVGQGMQDHAGLNVRLELRPEASIRTPDDRHTNCCVRYSSGDVDGGTADLMIVSLNQTGLAAAGAVASPGVGGVLAFLGSAHSRGTVELWSRSPVAQPVVRERMLSDERDQRRMRGAARTLVELASQPAIAELCVTPPAGANRALWEALDDDRRLDAHLLRVAVDTQHGTSTCPMGPDGAAAAVVDTACHVRGIDRLRVIDASVFPSVPRANTNLATIALGEAMADRLTA